MDDRGDDGAPVGRLPRAGTDFARFARLWLPDLAPAGDATPVRAARLLQPACAGRSTIKARDGADCARARRGHLEAMGRGCEAVRLMANLVVPALNRTYNHRSQLLREVSTPPPKIDRSMAYPAVNVRK